MNWISNFTESIRYVQVLSFEACSPITLSKNFQLTKKRYRMHTYNTLYKRFIISDRILLTRIHCGDLRAHPLQTYTIRRTPFCWRVRKTWSGMIDSLFICKKKKNPHSVYATCTVEPSFLWDESSPTVQVMQCAMLASNAAFRLLSLRIDRRLSTLVFCFFPKD